MYRPEGWKNPISPAAIEVRDAEWNPISHHSAYELGADAMLEALKKEDICGGKVYYDRQFGTWLQVFIPEGGHEGENPL